MLENLTQIVGEPWIDRRRFLGGLVGGGLMLTTRGYGMGGEEGKKSEEKNRLENEDIEDSIVRFYSLKKLERAIERKMLYERIYSLNMKQPERYESIKVPNAFYKFQELLAIIKDQKEADELYKSIEELIKIRTKTIELKSYDSLNLEVITPDELKDEFRSILGMRNKTLDILKKVEIRMKDRIKRSELIKKLQENKTFMHLPFPIICKGWEDGRNGAPKDGRAQLEEFLELNADIFYINQPLFCGICCSSQDYEGMYYDITVEDLERKVVSEKYIKETGKFIPRKMPWGKLQFKIPGIYTVGFSIQNWPLYPRSFLLFSPRVLTEKHQGNKSSK